MIMVKHDHDHSMRTARFHMFPDMVAMLHGIRIVMPATEKFEKFTHPQNYAMLHKHEAIIFTKILMQIFQPQIA